MNKGNYMVQEILKRLDKDSNSRKQIQSDNGLNINTQKVLTKNGSRDKASQRSVVLRKKQKNIFHRIFKLTPSLGNPHIYRLFGFMGINQKAIQNPDFSESFIYSHFHGRVVERIQFYDYAIVVQMTQPSIPVNQPSVQYLIEKFKAKGEAKFYQLAILIKEMCQILLIVQGQAVPEQKIESIKKWLDTLGDQMYVCTLGPRKFAISKSLLTYLQYDFEEFAIEAIKYRGIFHEFFSSISYGVAVAHLLKCLKHTIELNQGKISLLEFKQLTTYRFSDFIESKNHVRSFCDMTISLLNPTFLCHKINFIYYKGEDKYLKQSGQDQFLTELVEEKERVKQAEYKTLKKIKQIPHSLLKENHTIIAEYKIVQTNLYQIQNQNVLQ